LDGIWEMLTAQASLKVARKPIISSQAT